MNTEAEGELAHVKEALTSREPLFHRSEVGTTRADFDAMITEDFWEIGASGQYYRRAYVLDVLERRYRQPHEDHWSTTDFRCQQIAPAIFLLTYTLHQGARLTRRSTLWQRTAGAWKALFHQGTEVQDTTTVH